MLTRLRRPPAEKKFVDVTTPIAGIALAGNITEPWLIPQGAGSAQRVGYWVKPWRWDCKILIDNKSFAGNGLPVVARIIFGVDRNADAGAPVVGDIIDAITNPVLDPLNPLNFGRFKILRDIKTTFTSHYSLVTGTFTDGSGTLVNTVPEVVRVLRVRIRGSEMPAIMWDVDNPAANAWRKNVPFVLFVQSQNVQCCNVNMFARIRFLDG